MPSRRSFFGLAAGAVVPLVAPRAAWAMLVSPAGPHPDPRPGIDGSRVLRREQLGDNADVIGIFDMIRAIPQIADGIRCQCECRQLEEYRSLLTCFEGVGMAQHCLVCQDQAKLAFTMFRRGRSLRDIRQAIDREFG